MDGAALGTVVVEEYVRSYESTTETVTQCAVDVARMAPFTDALERLATRLRAVLGNEADRNAVVAAHAASVRFAGDLVDLRSFCANLVDGGVDEDVRDAARYLDAMLDPVGYVVSEGHHGQAVAGVGGVTVYFPDPFGRVSPFYSDLRFATDIGWDDFLGEYHRALRGR